MQEDARVAMHQAVGFNLSTCFEVKVADNYQLDLR
jgi:hypothetical protein